MRNNKILKICSLTLSSMIFSTSALYPVYASGHQTKKRVFSDQYSLGERVKSEGQAMMSSKEKEMTIEDFEPSKIKVKIVSPVPINRYKICDKIRKLENEVYKTDIYKTKRIFKNVFDVDFWTDVSFRGCRCDFDLKFFKNRVRKLYYQQWDENKLVPLNVDVYFYTMYLLQELNKKSSEKKIYRFKLWKEEGMTDKIRKLNDRRQELDDLVHTDETNVLFKFQCYIEGMIESLFEVREFYETLATKGGPVFVREVDTAIAMLWYIDQSITR